MSEFRNKKVWIIGSGLMAIEYAKVLNSLEVDYIVVGRSEASVINFSEKTNHIAIGGGLIKFLESLPEIPSSVIVAVGIESLSNVTIELMKYGVKKILLEKPGIGNPNEMDELMKTALEYNASVFLAYNRRFYKSVQELKNLVINEGGVTSFHCEFTEWSHVISKMKKEDNELNFWLLGNSTHVLDTAFYIAGWPTELVTFKAGGLNWHKSASIFSGAGVTASGALFSYIANWEAPGRWSIEICTPKRKYILKPMEKLFVQEIGSVNINEVSLDYEIDEKFKPGVFIQTKSFLEDKLSEFITLESQAFAINNFYKKIAGY